jgi:invasion protein IalB
MGCIVVTSCERGAVVNPACIADVAANWLCHCEAKEKFAMRAARALALLGLCAAFAGGAAAVEADRAPAVAERQFADWTLRCEETTCWIFDNAPREDAPHVPYAMTIGARAQEGSYRVLVHMAKAPRLVRKQGIELYADGQKAGHLAFARCDPDCVFLADYTPGAIETITAAQSLALLAPDALVFQGVTTPVSTTGLKEAFRAFRALPGLLSH